MSIGTRVKDHLSLHPMYDPAATVLTFVAAILLLPPLNLGPDGSVIVAFQTQAAFAGLTLAASTFACGLIYGSHATPVRTVRRAYSSELRRNWSVVLGITFVAGLLPIAAIFLLAVSSQVAFSLSAASMVALICASSRSIYWTHYVLLAEDLDGKNQWVDHPPYADHK